MPHFSALEERFQFVPGLVPPVADARGNARNALVVEWGDCLFSLANEARYSAQGTCKKHDVVFMLLLLLAKYGSISPLLVSPAALYPFENLSTRTRCMLIGAKWSSQPK